MSIYANRPGDPSASNRPLLTIAIPTFNRSGLLAGLLAMLEPQLLQFPQIELLISNNASEDDTSSVVAATAERFAALNIPFEFHNHTASLGGDGNFNFCFQQARGHFFWLCGDDDFILPGSVAQVIRHLQDPQGNPTEVDIIYATSYGFQNDYLAERIEDPFHRNFHTIHSAKQFAMIVNIMFTFISSIIVNKQRFEEIPHENPSASGVSLIQLSWSLPLLLHFRKGIVLWTRPVAARNGNAHGYNIGEVFGERLAANVTRLLPNRPDLSAPILNFALRRWFPSVLIDVRSADNTTLGLDHAHIGLRRAFGNNPRYWLFTYPALKLPLPAAKLYTKATAVLSKLLYMAHLPGFWRKQT